MDKHNFFFGEILDEFDLDNSLTRAENEIKRRMLDVRTKGVLSGCHLYEYVGDVNSFSVTPGIVIGPSGERIQLRDAGADTLGGYITTDSAGVNTSPGAGNYRWITVAVRFGRTMSSPKVDDLANTIYTDLTDSWNAQGVDFMADATQGTNEAQDGGFQIDNYGLSLSSFYIAAGPSVTIGNTLSYPSLPSDAVIIADILFTDGDEGNVLDKFAISHIRQEISYEKSSNQQGFPADSDLNFPKRLLWEIEAQQVKTRFYAGVAGLEITSNAAWDNVTFRYTADDTGKSATRWSLNYTGMYLEQKYSGDVGTPWTNVSASTGGWDSFYRLQASAQSEIGYARLNGNMIGNGIQEGYIASGLGTSNTDVTTLWTAIQFPRSFNGTPSSVTLGSAISEVNIASVSIGNINQYGATMQVNATTGAAFRSQRQYTATQ